MGADWLGGSNLLPWLDNMTSMREYLIKAAEGSGWIPVRKEALPAVLTPKGWGAEPVDGWGDYRVRVSGVEVSFAGEEPGWQVTVEGDLDPARADELVQTVASQIEA